MLSSDLETKIVSETLDAADKGFGISQQQLRTRVGTTLKRLNGPDAKVPGEKWLTGVKHRHPELTLRKPQKLTTVRAAMMNRPVVRGYFDDLGSLIARHNLGPHQIFLDENNFRLDHEPPYQLARKGAKRVPGRTSMSRESLTVVACGNAAGEKIPPMVIVRGKSHIALQGYTLEDAPENTRWCYQEKGWMTEKLSQEWFRKLFLPNISAARPQLLILDSHGSHEVYGLLKTAEAEEITMLALPPHTTHWLQPLDRCVFGPLQRAYNRACADYMLLGTWHQINHASWPAMFKQVQKPIVHALLACSFYKIN